MNHKRLGKLILAACTVGLLAANSAEAIGYIYKKARITQISVHNNNGDGDVVLKFDKDVCFSKNEDQARIYKKDSPGFETIVSLATAAFLAGKTVDVQTNSGDDCALQYLWVLE